MLKRATKVKREQIENPEVVLGKLDEENQAEKAEKKQMKRGNQNRKRRLRNLGAK